jgi:hypothetical protein
MATRDDVYAAIRNADKAGDTASVQKLAAYLQTMPADAGPTVTASPETVARVANDPISQDAKAGPSFLGELGRQAGNLIAGGVRGAGSIGATLMYPIDKATDLVTGDRDKTLSGLVTGQQPISRNQERRQDMDAGLTTLGADTTSPAFKVGKLGAEIAGTAGTGGAIANVVGRAAPAVAAAAPSIMTAIRTGGMTAPGATGLAGIGARAIGGAVNGAASAGMVDPSTAGSGSLIGAALPVVAKTAGVVGNAIGAGVSNVADSTAKRLMQSAIKPTIKQLASGDADTAVQTLLDYGINPNKAGVDKLRGLIDAKNTEIANQIGASTATIPKQNVIGALGPVRQKFGAQVSPTSDLAAIQGVQDDFMAHPNFPGADIPVQAAQDMKQGTYSVLRGKYGQVGSAETEAQKGLARGLKDEIATAVPAVGPLNADESKLLTTLSVTERRALMEMNKNPIGLAALAHNPVGWAAFMADKSALFKSLAARAVNSASGAPGAVQNLIGNPQLGSLAYRVAPVVGADQ